MGFYDWLRLKKKSLAGLQLGFFFSSQLRQKYPFGKVILGFFFGKGSWSQAIAEQIKVYRDQGFFNVRASLDEHELILGRYFYLFSFFFFSRLGERKGNFLLSKRSRKYWRLRYRNSTYMFLRKNMQWGTFRFRRAFKYIGRLYSFRRGALAYRGFLLRFIHYYFFLYYLYFHTLLFHKALFRRSRGEDLQRRSSRWLHREYRLYWRYFRRFFKHHWNYETTIRLASAQQRSKLLRRRFAIFLLLFKLHHEPTVRRTIKRRLDAAYKARRRSKNKYQGRVKVSRYVRINFPRWRLWYLQASRKFFAKRGLRRRLFFYLVIPLLAPTPPGPLFGKARERLWLRGPRTVRREVRSWRRRLEARLHGIVDHGARRLRRRLCRSFRFTPFFRTLKGAILRFMFYGFLRPAPLADPLFVSAGAFYRDPWSAGAFGFQRGLRRRAKRRLKRSYSAGSCSLLFRGRKRKFFIGYIPFGVGSKPFQQVTPAFDFSLGHLKLSFFFRRSRRAQFFLARGSYKARSLGRRPPQGQGVAAARRRSGRLASQAKRRPKASSAPGALRWDLNKRFI